MGQHTEVHESFKKKGYKLHHLFSRYRPIKVYNRESEPLFSHFLFLSMHSSTLVVMVFAFVTLLLGGVLLGLISKGLECQVPDEDGVPVPTTEYIYLSLGQLMGLGLDPASGKLSCSLVSAFASYGSLMAQLVIFGIFALRVLTPPKGQLIFSDTPVLKKRDGQLVMSFQVAHKFGRVIQNFDVTIFWIEYHMSKEGEKHGKFHKLKTNVVPVLFMPFTITHTLSEDSPMFGINPQEASGFFWVSASGEDRELGGSVSAESIYWPDDFIIGKAHDLLDVTPKMALETGEKPSWDYANFNIVEPSGKTFAELMADRPSAADIKELEEKTLGTRQQ